jgi:hypothetical protein
MTRDTGVPTTVQRVVSSMQWKVIRLFASSTILTSTITGVCLKPSISPLSSLTVRKRLLPHLLTLPSSSLSFLPEVVPLAPEDDPSDLEPARAARPRGHAAAVSNRMPMNQLRTVRTTNVKSTPNELALIASHVPATGPSPTPSTQAARQK